jgi:hypothetical protein
MRNVKFLIAVILTVIIAAAAAVNVCAYTISFTVFSDKEQQYIYEDAGSANSSGSRFCDGSAFIIYEFPVNTTDKYVSLNWTIANQYAVYVCTEDPDNPDMWKPIYFLERPADADRPDWNSYNPENVTHDLSKYAPLCTQGKIWIIMADSDTSGGWGGYISNTAPVVFKTSQKEAVVGAVAEYETAAPITETTAESATAVTSDISGTETPAVRRDAQPVYGIVGAVVTAGIFAAVFAIRRSL